MHAILYMHFKTSGKILRLEKTDVTEVPLVI